MKIAVISDIHGNMDALTRVLSDIDQQDVDDVISLGDNVGYGPESGEVIRRIQAQQIPSVIGNHELALHDHTHLARFNASAKISIEKTKDQLTDDEINFSASLNTFLLRHNCRFVHGFPLDCPLTYQFWVSEKRMRDIFSKMEEPLCFTGHTHCLELIEFDGQRISRRPLTEGETKLNHDFRYILNVGSVGQPWDGDNRAKYVILDTRRHSIQTRFIPYDIAAVAQKIIDSGLPEVHGLRLW